VNKQHVKTLSKRFLQISTLEYEVKTQESKIQGNVKQKWP